MSKVVMSLPKGMVKRSLIGGLVALGAYVLLQLLVALLIHKGVLAVERLYPAVCVAAAVASFLGCVCSMRAGKGGGSMLPVAVVVVVFLTLTVAVALMTADAVAIQNGLTGVGLSMAAGGLLAALVGGAQPKTDRSRTRKRRRS